MNEPSFLSVAQRNRFEGLGARKGDGEMRKGLLKASPLGQLWQCDSATAIPQRTVMAVPSNGLNMPRMCGDPALHRFGENGGRQGQSMGSLPSFVKLNRNVVGEQMAPS
jgi:hypothetical protein